MVSRPQALISGIENPLVPKPIFSGSWKLTATINPIGERINLQRVGVLVEQFFRLDEFAIAQQFQRDRTIYRQSILDPQRALFADKLQRRSIARTKRNLHDTQRSGCKL